ncbi:unnamed protein product [Cyprideis torosa]|uniref:Uncharacterized protein n=1 Tax=Cyprideis torosa TaxID=163714 RepID=A0A7R8WCF1_9CRUS|nr:unnamed protein product [Cyprideis torosa]CAG0887337.1 unnamed protein product [Cyprideis torosa]
MLRRLPPWAGWRETAADALGPSSFWIIPETGWTGNLLFLMLRIPPLFVLDRVLLDGLGLFPAHMKTASLVDTVAATERHLFPAFSANLFAFASSMLCVVLPTQHLFQLYLHLSLFMSFVLSQYLHYKVPDFVPSSFEREESGRRLLEALVSMDWETLDSMRSTWYPVALYLAVYFLQTLLGTLFYVGYFQHGSVSSTSKPLAFFFWFPCAIAMFIGEPTTSHPLREGHFYNWLVSIIIPVLFVGHLAYTRIPLALEAMAETFSEWQLYVNNFGVHALLDHHWTRLKVPTVLRTFWLLRSCWIALDFIQKASPELTTLTTAPTSLEAPLDTEMPVESFAFLLVKEILSKGCETLFAVLGLTAVVSCICHYVGLVFQYILGTIEEEERNTGTVTAILFFILALQTGITGLDHQKRFVRLCRNFCLLLTALFHFVHTMLDPVLMSLSAAPRLVRVRHIRALAVAALLFWVPLLLLFLFWTTQTPSTWLFAVSAFSLEVVVKVAISLALYTLFLLHARQEVAWESLDDYVYYIRAVGNTIEFLFGIFLFLNGAWILLFESGGAIRAVMMCIHAYFNIWCDAKAGWETFLKRRTAVSKINTLADATLDQLAHFNDVCAICYQPMRRAKVTRCYHMFHGNCLRKWLYIQDRCPLCLEVPHNFSDEAEVDREEVQEEEEEEGLMVEAVEGQRRIMRGDG